ncbi:MAG: ribose 5-phosphate isomerase B [Acidobacteriota bacterium]
MRIASGSDHAGFDLKNRLCRFLSGRGHAVEDLGTYSPESTDYPDWAAKVGHAVVAGQADFGVLVCGTGVGMAMAANKIHGVRAANCNNLFIAGLARAHNDANIVTLGAREVGPEHAEAIVLTFLETEFEDGRHARRIAKIAALES